MTTRRLHLAGDLTLPLDAVTQTFLVVGKRGSGKSNTAARFVEQLHHARLPFVVLDPVDTWWGLKAARDGGRGLDVYVFGGRKADLPLEAGGGALIAEVLCEHRLSMVLSVKHLSGRERSTFMVQFTQTLFQKWSGGPLHLVLEEAHEFAPQNVVHAKEGEQQMLGAFKRLWKLGRSSGIGGTAVTQRPASLNKDITTQAEILIAHRTIGPQDVKAVGEWVKYHGERLDMLADLPTLPTGEAFVWAPEFPEGQPIGLKRTAILLRETYDSASTPKVGEQRVEPKELAAVDLERLRAKMAATIEKAKAEDPRELHRRIAELRKELDAAKRPNSSVADGLKKSVERPVLTDADRALLARLADGLKNIPEYLVGGLGLLVAEAQKKFHATLEALIQDHNGDVEAMRREFERRLDSKGFQKILGKLEHIAGRRDELTSRATPAAAPQHRAELGRRVRQPDTRPSDDVRLNRLAERKILQVLAVHGPRTKRQLAIQAGYAMGGGGFLGALSKLKTATYIGVNGNGTLAITNDGRAAIGDVEALPTGEALVAYWMQQFNRRAEREVLRVLVAAYPRALTAEDIASRTNPPYEPSGGGFLGAVSKLRTLGLIEGRGELRASEELL